MRKTMAGLLAGLMILAIVLAGCGGGVSNRAPEIASVVATDEVVNPQGTTQITCAAFDQDRDPLTYAWTASSGTITGEGPTVDWAAPAAAGVCTITVLVSDGKGGQDTADVQISVTVSGQYAPYVKEVDADLPGPGPNFWDDMDATLTCVAIDPDPGDIIVDYEWAVTLDKGEPVGTGTITKVGNGQTAIWKFPKVPNKNEYILSVRCQDAEGNWSRTKYIPYSVWCECIRESGGGA